MVYRFELLALTTGALRCGRCNAQLYYAEFDPKAGMPVVIAVCSNPVCGWRNYIARLVQVPVTPDGGPHELT